MYPAPYVHDDYVGELEDVIVHSLLTILLARMRSHRINYLETHAGAGEYDLHFVNKTRENTIRRASAGLYNSQSLSGNAFLRLLRHLNGNAIILRKYPGSPSVGLHLLKNMTSIVLAEISPPVSRRLGRWLNARANSVVLNTDGYVAAQRICAQSSGEKYFIYMDPAYERSDEYDQIFETISVCSETPGIVIASTFPAATFAEVDKAFDLISRLRSRDLSASGTALQYSCKRDRLRGAGMLVVNGPSDFLRSGRHVLFGLARDLGLTGARLRAY